MQKMTLLFLVKREGGIITDICLAMKKRRFGTGKWNGVGGKVDPGESIEDAVVRETQEEIQVVPKSFKKVAEIVFTFPHKEEWNNIVSTYICDEWEGEPTETEEMNPRWFKIGEIPYDTMWADDKIWLPRVLAGEMLRASFTLGADEDVREHTIESIDQF